MFCVTTGSADDTEPIVKTTRKNKKTSGYCVEQYGILFSTVLFDLEVLMDHTLEKILARVQ